MALIPSLGASIRIFLAQGIADGVWVVEKSNWTGKALMAPRTGRSLYRVQEVDLPESGSLVGAVDRYAALSGL